MKHGVGQNSQVRAGPRRLRRSLSRGNSAGRVSVREQAVDTHGDGISRYFASPSLTMSACKDSSSSIPRVPWQARLCVTSD
jgi:hypothetical protein